MGLKDQWLSPKTVGWLLIVGLVAVALLKGILVLDQIPEYVRTFRCE